MHQSVPGHDPAERVPGRGLPVQTRNRGPEGAPVALRMTGELLCLLLSPVPPSIREDGRRANVSGMAGQSLTLECDASGFPAPEITWLKNGQLVGVPWGGQAAGGSWSGRRPPGQVPACAAVWQGDVAGVSREALGLRAGEHCGPAMQPRGGEGTAVCHQPAPWASVSVLPKPGGGQTPLMRRPGLFRPDPRGGQSPAPARGPGAPLPQGAGGRRWPVRLPRREPGWDRAEELRPPRAQCVRPGPGRQAVRGGGGLPAPRAGAQRGAHQTQGLSSRSYQDRHRTVT